MGVISDSQKGQAAVSVILTPQGFLGLSTSPISVSPISLASSFSTTQNDNGSPPDLETEIRFPGKGLLWVRRLTWPEEGGSFWDVFNPSGRSVTALRSPARFEVHDIGEDYILGVWKDDFDVECVRMYSLRGG